MARRLFMVLEGRHPLDELTDVADDEFAYDRIDWESFKPEHLQACAADLVVLVAGLGDPRAVQTFEWLKTHSIPSPTMAVLPDNPAHDLLQAAAAVVDDFVVLPVCRREWRHRVLRLVSAGRGTDVVTDRLSAELAMMKLVGRAPAFVRTMSLIPGIARNGSPVLITGETGTGKELCARAIHHLGRRRDFPFVPVDCGAVPDHLFENELFGHARGAFTDAHGDQRGLVAMADRGTLFLDEIDALPLIGQSKLLRFLQERTFKPLGADRFVRADVNVLAATNRNLDSLVREQRFRADLYFRLNVLTLHMQPLRQRREDIQLLAQHFADAICAEQALGRTTVSPQSVRKLTHHDWPGNVRELYNVMQRAVLYADGGPIRPCHIVFAPGGEPRAEDGEQSSFRQAREKVIEAFERAYVDELLRRHGGNVSRAAREARKERRAFGRLAKKYGILHEKR